MYHHRKHKFSIEGLENQVDEHVQICTNVYMYVHTCTSSPRLSTHLRNFVL